MTSRTYAVKGVPADDGLPGSGQRTAEGRGVSKRWRPREAGVAVPAPSAPRRPLVPRARGPSCVGPVLASEASRRPAADPAALSQPRRGRRSPRTPRVRM